MILGFTWGLSDHVFIYRLYSQAATQTQTKNYISCKTLLLLLTSACERGTRSIGTSAIPLSRGTIHDYVDPEDLHSIEWVRHPHESRQGD